MSRFTKLFQKLKSQNRPAYIPFLMLGDPTMALSLKVINSVIEGGADGLELGIPFSDPIADGPIVQQAATRARLQGATIVRCFELIKEIRQQNPELPIGLLVYANLVFHDGISAFYRSAKLAGVDAVLVPDVPTKEALPFINEAKAHGINPILLATLTCSTLDLQTLASLSEGYTYVVTRAGVTGVDQRSEFESAQKIVNQLKAVNAPPSVFGFGIRDSRDVQQAFDCGAKGVIIGSALIQTISKMTKQDIEEGTKIRNLTQSLFGSELSLLP